MERDTLAQFAHNEQLEQAEFSYRRMDFGGCRRLRRRCAHDDLYVVELDTTAMPLAVSGTAVQSPREIRERLYLPAPSPSARLVDEGGVTASD